jgi:hypothetical protein
MARFKKFDSRGRLARVLAVVRGEPTGARPTTQVRIKLGALPAPLRAIVRDESHGGMLIEAELPWLTVGSEIQAEFPDGREKAGRVHWFGVDATSAGSARLRIFVDLSAANEGVPAQLPDVAELAGTRPRRWPWALATVILMMVTSVVVYALARRPAQPALLPSPVVAEAAPPRAPAAVTVPKEQSEASPPPTSPSVAIPHTKAKRKRR